MDLPPLEQLRLEQVGDHAGVMHRASGHAVMVHVGLDVGIENIHHQLAGLVVHCRQLGEARVAGQHFVSDVQRQVGQFDPAAEHHFGGLRVGEQVELGHRGDVATVEVRAAHHHHFLDALGDFRRLDQRQGQVGLRA
ncbi:hypothetical protein D3C77_270570 [compost metagenome]